MNIWAKEIKEKRKNCNSSHTIFGSAQQERRQEKEKKRVKATHTPKKYPFLLFLSN